MMNPDTDHLDTNIGPVLGLEVKYFNDDALFRRIVDEVFFKNWLLACHASQLSKPGDYQTLEIYDQDILITHTRDGSNNVGSRPVPQKW